MTTPRWGHKPAAVPDVETYWSHPAPEPSARMAYWARRYRAGEWAPNRALRREGYYGRAQMLGVWLWEANGPATVLMRLAEGLVPNEALVGFARASGIPASYWTVLEERSRWGVRDPDESWRDDRFGLLVDDLEAVSVAAATSPGMAQFDKDRAVARQIQQDLTERWLGFAWPPREPGSGLVRPAARQRFNQQTGEWEAMQ